MLHPETRDRIRMVAVDSETGQELERRNLAKGYVFKKNRYLIITDIARHAHPCCLGRGHWKRQQGAAVGNADVVRLELASERDIAGHG